jgi:uncharacterized metal-binding protein
MRLAAAVAAGCDPRSRDRAGAAARILSLDQCADQYVLALRPDADAGPVAARR